MTAELEKEIRHLRWELESEFGVVAELRFDNQRLRELADVMEDRICAYVDELQTMRNVCSHPPPGENPPDVSWALAFIDKLLLVLIGRSTPSMPDIEQLRAEFMASITREETA